MKTRIGILLAVAVSLHPRLLAAAPPAAVAIRGQVACSECWSEADRSKVAYGTEADLKCAARCDKEGIAAALVVKEGADWKVYKLEDGAFKREGKGWLKYMGKQAEVRGVVREAGKDRFLKVDALTVLPEEGARRP